MVESNRPLKTVAYSYVKTLVTECIRDESYGRAGRAEENKLNFVEVGLPCGNGICLRNEGIVVALGEGDGEIDVADDYSIVEVGGSERDRPRQNGSIGESGCSVGSGCEGGLTLNRSEKKEDESDGRKAPEAKGAPRGSEMVKKYSGH